MRASESCTLINYLITHKCTLVYKWNFESFNMLLNLKLIA